MLKKGSGVSAEHAEITAFLGKGTEFKGVLSFEGTIRVDGKQVGSLEFEAVCEVAGRVTPVPGGVGPVTNVILLQNAIKACKAQTGVK